MNWNNRPAAASSRHCEQPEDLTWHTSVKLFFLIRPGNQRVLFRMSYCSVYTVKHSQLLTWPKFSQNFTAPQENATLLDACVNRFWHFDTSHNSSSCTTFQSNSCMHRYECVTLRADISLQRGRFCARSLASCIPRSSEDRSSSSIS